MKKTRQFLLEAMYKIAEAIDADDVMDTYQAWKEKSTDKIANWFAANKSSLDKLKKDMPKTFQPPIGKKAYRGASIPQNVASAILKTKAGKSPTIVSISDVGEDREGPEKFIVVQNVPYTPHRKAQSWTLNKGVAANFSSPTSVTAVDVGVSEDNVGVVYEATIDNTFYLNPNAFSDYETYATDEKEVLRIGGKGNYTMYVRMKDLPPNIALQFGGKGLMSKFKQNVFEFLTQWFSDSISNKKNEDIYIKGILIDKKSGKIQVQARDGSVMSVDDFFNECEKRKVLRKISWRDKKTPYNRALIKKTITTYEKGFAGL
jgi:hypothetical protein